MKKLLVLLALCSLLSIPAFAGDAPKFEVFGGYSFVHALENKDLEDDAMTLQGFVAEAEYGAHPNIGIVAEFGFYQNSEDWSEWDGEYTGAYRWRDIPFLFGPRFGYRGDKFRVFGHYLFGFVKNSYLDKGDDGEIYTDWSDTNFAQAVGGGVDIVLSDKISVRPAQFDWMSSKISDSGDDWTIDTWINGMRYSAGIVFTFGK
jgi:opacity protein-like surface antigen